MRGYKLMLAAVMATVASTSFGAPAGVVLDNADDIKGAVTEILRSYLPGTSGFAPAAESVTVSDDKRTITVSCNEASAYLPLTPSQADALKKDIQGLIPDGYCLELNVGGRSFDELALFASKPYTTPSETSRFITRADGVKAPAGLDGSNIALWQSHGWYFEPKLNRWEWQRARIFQTVEDLYTQSYVMPFLMPMLQNAGAYVMSPRERDVRTTEIIIDNDTHGSGYSEPSGRWSDTPSAGFGHDGSLLTNNENPFRNGTARMTSGKGARAEWRAAIPESGSWAVYISYQTLPESTTGANYTVKAADGDHEVTVNQRMGGGTWIYLGHYPFEAGDEAPLVTLVSETADGGAVSADAVKIGGGLGNVARIVDPPLDPEIEYRYVSSGYPRFTEGARYFLQWAGAPDSVYTPTGNVNDYNDDYRSRALWVNWLAGGSSVLPGREGLNIPVDLSFAFHSDAGTTLNDSIIGTLGIYCTDHTDLYPSGTSRLAARDLTNAIMTNITDDIRRQFEPNWTRRGMWDSGYAEARAPQVPAMLLELLSHQNFADMKYGLDPAFRFAVSRAVYKGMLQYIANRDGRPYVVQPLPVRSFAISGGKGGKYTLVWAERTDSLEPTAAPTYYIVQERVGEAAAFRTVATVDKPRYDVKVKDSDIHSYRIIAGNDGGVSFPSEVLALCHRPDAPTVLVVNGFTRVSAPDWFDSGEIAGFYDERDPGVPYIQDISLIGSQFEYRRDIPWMDDDAAGFGASRSNYEREVVAGNTFDYVLIHGQAIADAGCGFISSSVDAFTSMPQTKETPAILDLILGKQKEIKRGTGAYGTDCKAFPESLQQRIRAFTQAGGSVFVSGSFIATDIWDNPFSSAETAERDKEFASQVLGYNWRVGQASVTGEAYEVQSRFHEFSDADFSFYNTLNPEFYAVQSPDSFYASDPAKGATIMRYTENNLVAGTACNAGTYRTVCIGFPFETIKDAASRSLLMKQILTFFNK